jgi:hypothetical protein
LLPPPELCSKLPTHHPEDRNTTAAAVSAAAAAMQATVAAAAGGNGSGGAGGIAGTAPAIIDPKAQDLQFLFLAMTEEVRTALYCLCAAAVLRWVTLHVLLHACLAPRPAPGLPADTFFLHCFPMPHFLPLFVASLLSSLPLSAARCASLW